MNSISITHWKSIHAVLPQYAHLSDGRRYEVEVWCWGAWQHMIIVDSTAACDYAIGECRKFGYERARGLPINR